MSKALQRTASRFVQEGSAGFLSLLCAVSLSLFVFTTTANADGSMLSVGSGSSYHILGPHMDLLEDPGRTLTIHQVTSEPYHSQFSPYNKDFPSFGFTESAFWYRVHLVNPTSEPQELILEETTPYIDSIKLFTPDPDASGGFAVRHVGDKKLFKDREILHNYFLFRLILQPNQSLPLYLRVQSRAAVITPFTFWMHDAYEVHSRNVSLYFGLFFGILAVFTGFSIYLWLRLRDRVYLYYALFIISVALMVSTSHGLSYMHLWPESLWLAERMQVVSISLIQFFGLLFARKFLNTRVKQPRTDWVLLFLAALHGAIISLSLVVSNLIPLAKLTLVAVQLYAPVLLVAGFFALRQGDRSARFYLFAWSSSLIGSVVTALTLLNVLPYHFALLNAVSIGFLADTVFLSFALTDRIFVMRRERDEAQSLAHSALQSANENLEVEVARRTHELQQAKQDAELANQAKTSFLSHMSHELRTPLIGIIGFSELMVTDTTSPLAPDQARNAKIIYESGIHLKELIDDVLDISIIESGRIEIEAEPVLFNDVLEDALAMTRPMAAEKETKLLNATQVDGKFIVLADPRRLCQAIINLLTNAIKYSPSSSCVSVKLESSGANVRLAVADNGPGIAKEKLDVIFEPFSRLKDGSKAIEGVGIGLALSRNLINLMKGQLTVESTVGQGSTFYIEIPQINSAD